MMEEISFSQLVKALKEYRWLLFLSTLTGVVIATVITFFVMTPKYSSQAQLMIALDNPVQSGEMTNVTNDLNLSKTYKELVKSDVVIKEVKEKLKATNQLVVSEEFLKAAVDVKQEEDSLLLSIEILTENAEESMHIANAFAKVFRNKAEEVMGISKLVIISDAQVKLKPMLPNIKANLIAGLVFGVLIGGAIFFVIELYNQRLTSIDSLKEAISIDILGSVSLIEHKKEKKKL